MQAGLARQPRSAAGRLVTHRLYRQPSSASNRVSWAPGCGRPRWAKTRMLAGQPAKVARRAFAQQPGQLSDVHSGGIDLRLAAWNPGILDTS